MAVITSVVDTYKLSDVLKHQYGVESNFTQERVIVNEASGLTYGIGTVLGKVTATGKYKRQEASAVDGSQTAAAVVLEDKAVTAATDTGVLVLVRGPAIVNKARLVMGASTDLQAEKDAVYASLAALGILANTGI